jgi:hypothetical protein
MGFDGKYGQVTTERKDIPADEPVIVIRAKDKLAAIVIGMYADLCMVAGLSDEHQGAVAATTRRFLDWQEAHPGQVKLPDTQPGEYQ